MTEQHLMAIANIGLCVCAVLICVCRLNAMDGRSPFLHQAVYAACVGAASYSALQPWQGNWPGVGSLTLIVAMIIGLMYFKPRCETCYQPEDQPADK